MSGSESEEEESNSRSNFDSNSKYTKDLMKDNEKKNLMDFIEVDDDSDDSDYIGNDMEDEKYKTNLDSQCEIMYLNGIMANMTINNSNYYNYLMSEFSKEEILMLQNCMLKASNRFELKIK